MPVSEGATETPCSIRSLRREPLVWFLMAGLLLFALHAWLSPNSEYPTSRRIHVERDDLLELMQLRARSFNEASATARLEGLTPEEVTSLVDDLVREEVLYREALRLGLDRNDYVIRRRMVQSLEYIAQGEGADRAPPNEPALRRFYEANPSRYKAPASVSFSHVFFSSANHGWNGAERLAREAHRRMLSRQELIDVPPGERFLYLRNYVARSHELIESHFGRSFADNLFNLQVDQERWQGPLRSEHGFHLVRIAASDPRRALSFAEARAMIAEDAAEEAARMRSDAFVASLLTRFDVEVSEDVRRLMVPGT